MAGSWISGLLEANAANNAANEINSTAQSNANLFQEAEQQELGYQQNQYGQTEANLNPYIASGTNSLATLNYLMNNGGNTTGADTGAGAAGSLLSPYPGGQFTAPTAAQAAATPDYQFALQQGENAVQSGAAASGSLLTGGTLNAENQYAQGLANTNYNNIYNQALQNYNTNYNTWQNQNTNNYNRLMGMNSMGLNASTALAGFGQNAANAETGIVNNATGNMANQYSIGANAIANGYIGSTNAWTGAINNTQNQMQQLAMMMNSGYGGNGGGGSGGITNLGYGGNGALTLGGVGGGSGSSIMQNLPLLLSMMG